MVSDILNCPTSVIHFGLLMIIFQLTCIFLARSSISHPSPIHPQSYRTPSSPARHPHALLLFASGIASAHLSAIPPMSKRGTTTGPRDSFTNHPFSIFRFSSAQKNTFLMTPSIPSVMSKRATSSNGAQMNSECSFGLTTTLLLSALTTEFS